MGIDVWVRRHTVPLDRIAPVVDSADAQTGAAVPLPAATDADAPVDVVLDCIAGAGVVIIGAFADPADGRFVQDVLTALTGGEASAQRSAFRWPQTQTGDQRSGAARQAYAGFISGQTQRAAARCLLLFGPAATMLLPADAGGSDYAVLRLDAIADLRREPVRKKALWLTINRFARR
jgi:hypothetical protein